MASRLLPCSGLTVADFGQHMAGSLPGMILADYGADVVKVEPPSGDPARGTPGFLMWNRGKRGITLDLRQPGDRELAAELAGRADVVIESFRPGVAERLGIGPERLTRGNGRLVYCSISGFGPASAYKDVPGIEGLVAAAAGWMIGRDHLNGAVPGQDRDDPIFTAVPVASYGAAQLALQGILAALWERDRSGRGTVLRTSLVQGLAAFLMRQELGRGSRAAVSSPMIQAGIELCFMTAECADGRFLQMCARQDRHFENWMRALGLEAIFDDPRYARAPLGIETMPDLEELDQLIRKSMRNRTSDEWMRVFTEDYDVGADPFLTFDEFLDHPQMVENDRVIELDDPRVGRCRQVGPIALFSDLAIPVPPPAPSLGEHNPTVRAWLAESGARQGAASSTPPPTQGPPLAGITILECSYFIAGPLAGTLLAELGARVIKVEPLAGDPYRRTGLQAAKFMHGKESIALDLKQPEATRILHQLVEGADVFVHSFRSGVPERLGIDHGRLRSIRPDLVYVNAASYGSRGPQSTRAAFHSTPNALVGSGILQAGAGNPPVDDSYPDPGSALGVATAILLGLHARSRLGTGSVIETTMLTSAGYIMSPYLVRYEGRQDLPVPDQGQHGFSAQYRLYRCLEGWVFVAVTDDDDWRAVARTVGRESWATDPALADSRSRLENDRLVLSSLENVLATRTAAEWEREARSAGAPIVAVSMDPIETWLERQQLLVPVEHPAFGEYWLPPAKGAFDRLATRRGPAAAVGEHTAALLAELGYGPEQVAALVDKQVVGAGAAPPS